MKSLDMMGRVFLYFAAMWSVVAGLVLLLTPLEVQTLTAQGIADDAASAIVSSQSITWYEAQGLTGILILVLFAFLYVGMAYLSWVKRWIGAALFAAIAILLTLLAGFSIGAFYMPAAMLSLVGLILLGIHRLRSPITDSLN